MELDGNLLAQRDSNLHDDHRNRTKRLQRRSRSGRFVWCDNDEIAGSRLGSERREAGGAVRAIAIILTISAPGRAALAFRAPGS